MRVVGSAFIFACGASAREVGNHQHNIGAGDVVVAVSPNGNTDGHEVETKQNVQKSEHGGMYPAAPHKVAMIPTSSFADCDCPSKPHTRMLPDPEYDGDVSDAVSDCDCSSSGLEAGMQTVGPEAVLRAWNGIELPDKSVSQIERSAIPFMRAYKVAKTAYEVAMSKHLAESDIAYKVAIRNQAYMKAKEVAIRNRVYMKAYEVAIRKQILGEYLAEKNVQKGPCTYGAVNAMSRGYFDIGTGSTSFGTAHKLYSDMKFFVVGDPAVDDLVLIKENPTNKVGVVTAVIPSEKICTVRLADYSGSTSFFQISGESISIYATKLFVIDRPPFGPFDRAGQMSTRLVGFKPE